MAGGLLRFAQSESGDGLQDSDGDEARVGAAEQLRPDVARADEQP
jgi:hypothetical protein